MTEPVPFTVRSYNYDILPEYMRGGAKLYVEYGVSGVGFFQYVVENNLTMAFAKADHINIRLMRDWASWLYNDAPAGCRGSPDIVKRWMESGGIR